MPAILITGANRGLGLEFARQFARDGYRVFATARRPAEADELGALARSHAHLSVHALEIRDGKSVQTLARELSGEPLDILVNNAGTMGPKGQRLGEIDYDGMLETIEINAIAPLRITEALLPNIERGTRKLVVALTSGMGSIADSSGGAYAYRASKAALNMTFHNLGLDLKSRGITVIAINPGWVQTDMGGKRAPTTPETSIAKMREVFDKVTPEQTGSFMDYKGGTWPW